MNITHGLLSGHVLQRTKTGASVTITGTADLNKTDHESGVSITATISKGRTPLRGWSAKIVGKSSQGTFSVTLKGIPTGGPYTVTLTLGKQRAVVKDVFVGDLWLMAGQSNMEGVGNLSDAPKPHPLVRNFNMDLRWSLATDPLHHPLESPDRCHNTSGVQQPLAERAAAKKSRLKGVGVGVYFGILMHRRNGVPQGLIATAHGGTSMAQWDPAARTQGGDSLYYSMLESLRAVGQPLAGVLWYQGCSDAVEGAAADVYSDRMQGLVAAVRADLGQPKLPWITVQIARFIGQHGGERQWNSVQDQQRRLPDIIAHLATVPAIDLELDDAIHVSGKAYALLAERMANAAARLVHADKRALREPQLVSVHDVPTATGPTLEVRFAQVVGGLRAPGLPLGFTLVDPDHQAHRVIYKTSLKGDCAILHLIGDSHADLRLMYGYGKEPVCNITDGRGLPLPVFGPIIPANRPARSAWMSAWQKSAIRLGETIATHTLPTAATCGLLTKHQTGSDGFVDCHEQWQGKTGHVAFFSSVSADQALDLEVLAGFDGPFRLWIGVNEIITGLDGTNPAVRDAVRKSLRLKKGVYQVTVLMALNHGKAWGFFLRFGRTNLTPAETASGQVALPVPLAN